LKETEQISLRLRAVMLRLGMKSKEKLAEKLGYSRTQLHYIEKGEYPITSRFLETLTAVEKEVGIEHSHAAEQRTHETEHFVGEEAGEVRRTLSVGGPYSPRIKDEAEPTGNVARSDAEIAALTALLSEHAALVQSGVRKGELPVVRRALELALESRGILPRKSE
jgi:transcriptional regulator with XRE-family HTH domain